MIGRRSFIKAGAALFSVVPFMREWLAFAQSDVQFLIPPTTHHVTETSAHLHYWLQPGIPSAELVLWQGDSEIRRVALSGEDTTITLSDLEAATTYRYEVLVDGRAPGYADNTTWGAVTFRTQPYEWPIRFAAIGDSGFGDNITLQLAEHIAAHDLDFFMHLGDVVYRCDDWGNNLSLNFARKYYLPFQEILHRVPHYPTLGNHDRDFPTRLNGQSYYHYAFPPFEEPDAFNGQRLWYQFQANDVRFLCLNTQCYFTDPGRAEQNIWLDARLAEQDPRTNVIFYHVPFRATTDVHPDDGLAPAGDWEGRFQEHAAQIALVMSGHAHLYERWSWGGVRYITSGGGSAAIYPTINSMPIGGSEARASLAHYTLVEIYPDHVHSAAYDINNTLIDEAEWAIEES